MALVLVLWVLTLLTVMAGSFSLSMRREASVIQSIRDSAEAGSIAEAGIALAEQMLLGKDPEKRWKMDGTIYQLGYADAMIRLQVFDERGKIDINQGDPQLLKSLLEYAGITGQQKSEITDAILDWRDTNDLVHINGAEKNQYEDAGLPYHPRNKPFKTIDELQLVLGMNEQIYNKIEPLITIYSGQKQVDKKRATKEVLQAITDVNSDAEGDLSAAQPAIIRADETTAAAQNAALPASTAGPGKNDALTIIAEAKLKNGAKSMIKAIIKQRAGKNGQPFTVLDWKRGHVNDATLFAGE